MRSIKDLLIILVSFMKSMEIDSIDEHGDCIYDGDDWLNSKVFWGMCNTLARMNQFGLITKDEETLVNTYIWNNTPEGCKGKPYWWKPVVREPRIKWIQQQLNKLS